MKTKSNKKVNIVASFISINLFKNLLGIIRTKIIAVIHGVEQLGILGQFLTIFNFDTKFITFGTTASLVNSYNLSSNNQEKRSIFFLNFLVIIFANIITTFILLLFIQKISIITFGHVKYSNLLLLLLILNYFYSLSIFLELTFQARQKFTELAFGRSLGIIVALISVVPLSYYYGVTGIVIDLLILYVTSLLYFAYKSRNSILIFFNSMTIASFSPEKSIILRTLKIALSDLTRTIFILGSLYISRIIIIDLLGLKLSGFYQAVFSVSNYINIILVGFMVYFFPVIGSEKIKNLKREIGNNFELVFLLIFPIIFILLLFPGEILELLISVEFVHLKELLSFVVFSKLFYFYYFFSSIVLLGRNSLNGFLILEIARSIFLVLSTYYFSLFYGLTGAIMAIILTDFTSMILVLLLSVKFKSLIYPLNKLYWYFGGFFVALILLVIPDNIFLKISILILLVATIVRTARFKKLFQIFNQSK